MRASAFDQRELFLYLFAILTSVLLSFWIDYRETVINPDAICYLLSAESVGKLGVSGAMQLCGQAKWPFYSVLVYGLVQISHLTYPAAAYILDAVFSLLSVLAFILIVKELGGSRRVLWLAALVILLSHEFNSVREYIIRDHGFWAFYLGSLLFLLRYFKKPTWQTALAWSASLLIATLFRIEGAIFLIAIPFLSLFQFSYSMKQRIKFFFTLNLLMLLICLTMGCWFLLHPQQTLDKLGRVSEVTAQIQHGFSIIIQRYQSTKLALAQHVLTSDSEKEAGLVLFIVLFAWYVINVIGNLSWIYAFLVIYALQQKAVALKSSAALAITGYLIINIVVTLGFLFEHLFLSKRYLIALTLVFMLFVPFALDKLWQNRNILRHRLFLLVSVCFIFISALGGVFDFGYSKAYIHGAGDWLAKNVPDNASLYANDYQLMYYSRHFGDKIFQKQRQYVHVNTIAQGRWKQYDYIALRVNKKEEAELASLLQEMQLAPTKVFSNKRGDQVVIYKVQSENK